MTDRIAAALSEGAARLHAGPTAMRDARILLAHAAGFSREDLHRLEPSDLTGEIVGRYFDYLERRVAGEPVSRILGYRDFWNGRFRIAPGILDPRPETEMLVAQALEAPFLKVLDLGTGSACILLSLLAERESATGIGTDLFDVALEVARTNAAEQGLSDRAAFVRSNWFDEISGTFDLIVSNPPYIATCELAELAIEVRDHDPVAALSPGTDGLAAYRAITSGVRNYLQPGGRLLVEVGWRQGEAVAELFRASGLEAATIRPDLDGRDRVVSGIAPE